MFYDPNACIHEEEAGACRGYTIRCWSNFFLSRILIFDFVALGIRCCAQDFRRDERVGEKGVLILFMPPVRRTCFSYAR